MSTRAASLLLPVCFGSVLLPAWAQNTLTVPIEVVRVSNPNLVPAGEDESRRGSATLLRIHPQYTLEMANGASRTELTLGGLIERSSNTALSADRSLPSIGVLWESRGSTSVLGLSASLAEESTRETEFADFGRVALDGTQRTGSLGATWTTELTSSSALELAVFHSRVTFDTSQRLDYQETGGSVSYRWQRSANSRYAMTASTARQRRDQDGGSADVSRHLSRNGLVLGYEADLSERVTLAARAGVARTNSLNSQTHAVGGFRLASERERLTYALELGRDVTSDGTERGATRTDTVSGSVGYLFTADTSLTIGLSRARSLDGDRSVGTFVYAQIRTELTPFWAVTTGFEHRRAQSPGALPARGHAVTLGLVYTHPDF